MRKEMSNKINKLQNTENRYKSMSYKTLDIRANCGIIESE